MSLLLRETKQDIAPSSIRGRGCRGARQPGSHRGPEAPRRAHSHLVDAPPLRRLALKALQDDAPGLAELLRVVAGLGNLCAAAGVRS